MMMDLQQGSSLESLTIFKLQFKMFILGLKALKDKENFHGNFYFYLFKI